MAVLVLIFTLASAVIVYYFLRDRYVQMNGKEVATASGTFLKQLKNEHTLVQNLKCDKWGNCSKAETGAGETEAWRLLAFASLAKATNDPAYKEASEKTFARFIEIEKKSISENMWQSFNVYKLTGDYRFAGFFADRMFPSLLEFKLHIKDDHLKTREPMWNGTQAIEMFQASSLFAEAGAPAALLSSGYKLLSNIDPHQWVQAYIDQGDRIVSIMKSQSKENPRIFSEVPDYGTDACWIELAEWTKYKSNGDQSALDEVTYFLNKAKFDSRPTKQINLQVLQSILPCAQVLKEISKSKPQFQTSYEAVVENFLLPSFDGSKRPICEGDDAVLSSFDPTLSGDICSHNVKSTADISWMISLLADNSTIYKLKR